LALVKIKPFAFGGAFLVILGIVTLLHPHFLLPANRQQISNGGDIVITETRRVLRVPVTASIVFIVCGCGLLFVSTRNPVPETK